MFTFDKNLQRRVSISHEHSAFVARIASHNQRTLYICLLLAFTGGFLFFCSILIPPMFRARLSTDLLYMLPFLGFFVLWYLIGLRIGLWRAFGIEEITVKGGVLCWTRTALWWRRTFEVPACDITKIEAITPWHSLSNRLEFVARGRVHAVGDMLLR